MGDHTAEKLQFWADILHNVTLYSYRYFKACTGQNAKMLQKSTDSSSEKKKQQQQTGEEHKFLHVSSGKQWILRCKQWVLKNVLAFAVLYQMKIRR